MHRGLRIRQGDINIDTVTLQAGEESYDVVGPIPIYCTLLRVRSLVVSLIGRKCHFCFLAALFTVILQRLAHSLLMTEFVNVSVQTQQPSNSSNTTARRRIERAGAIRDARSSCSVEGDAMRR